MRHRVPIVEGLGEAGTCHTCLGCLPGGYLGEGTPSLPGGFRSCGDVVDDDDVLMSDDSHPPDDDDDVLMMSQGHLRGRTRLVMI